MDILETLTADFDRLRDLTIDYALATEVDERVSLFRQLVRYQDVTAKAQASVLGNDAIEVSKSLEFVTRQLLERYDVMDEIATNISRSNRADLRETKMDLYTDLVIQRIADSERDLLPYIYENISETDRARMAKAYTKYRDIAL